MRDPEIERGVEPDWANVVPPALWAICASQNSAAADQPPASPSTPSLMFVALTTPTMNVAAKITITGKRAAGTTP